MFNFFRKILIETEVVSLHDTHRLVLDLGYILCAI
jgi:hypothetical protein